MAFLKVSFSIEFCFRDVAFFAEESEVVFVEGVDSRADGYDVVYVKQ